LVPKKYLDSLYKMSLPSNLRYQSKTESAPARRFLTQIQPQGGTSFSQGETITLNLPTRSNTCLIPSESYLKGQLNIVVSGATTATTLESCGFHAFIQRVRVFHGSNLLEDIDNYHQLAKVLHDYQAPEDTVKGRLSITAGTNPDFSVLQAAAAGDVLNAASVNRGRALGALGASTHSFPFALNLISLVGSLCGDKYLPLFELSAAPLRCEIVLQSSAARALMNLGGTIGSFNVTGVNYCGEYLEIPDAAVSSIKSASSSPMQMVVPSYRSYTNSATIPAASMTEVSFPIPAKFSSLKNIFVVTRSNAATGVNAQFPMSHCAFGNGTSNVTRGPQFRIGPEVLPSTAPLSHAEMYSEAIKCFGSIADLQNQPSITNAAYILDAPVAVTNINTASTTESGDFVIGIDTEVYQSTAGQSIFNGTNTNNSDIFSIINYYSSGGITALQTAFAAYDQVLVMEGGVCYARY
jgi:hypothetical protein